MGAMIIYGTILMKILIIYKTFDYKNYLYEQREKRTKSIGDSIPNFLND